ncbi:MAG TPA: flagellar hook-length control protein FliK [Burkholderiaceae bacterium]|nr:flagellar hook-length control protein FliK [Burkholderiaceae bacterium]
MTSTSVIAVSASNISAKAPASSNAQPPGDSPAFRDVLANQSNPRAANQAPAKNTDGQGSPVSSGNGTSTQAAGHPAKPEQAGKAVDDKKADDKKSIADAPSPAGTGLPGIALYIAAEANAPLRQTVSSGEAHTPEGAQGVETARTATSASGRAHPGPAAIAASTGDETPLPAPPVAIAPPASTNTTKQPEASPGNAATSPLAASAASGSGRPEHSSERAGAASLAGTGNTPVHPVSESVKNTGQTHQTVAAQIPPMHAGINATPSPNGLPLVAQAAPTHGLMATTASATGPAITIPLQNPRWPTELGRQFVAIAQSSQSGLGHTAQLRLDPPNLGPLHIAIHVSDNVAQAVFFSPHAQVRQAVENALPQLQQQLAQAGIALGQASVSDQGASRQAFDDDAPSSRRRAAGVTTTVAVATGQPVAAGTRASAPNGLVDTFA